MGTFKLQYDDANVLNQIFIAPGVYGSQILSADDASFEGGIGSWVANAGAFTLTSDAAVAHKGTGSLKLVSTGSGAGSVSSGGQVVVGSTSYAAVFWLYTPTTQRSVVPSITWFSDAAATVLVATTQGASRIEALAGWTLYAVGGTSPATAIRARMNLSYGNRALNEIHYLDDLYLSLITNGVTAVRAEAWGSGGNGATGQATRGGGGGGGGGYGRRNALAVTPGQSYNVAVGTAGLASAITGDAGVTAQGNSGNFGSTFNGGTGGTGTGDVTFTGGAGRTVPSLTTAGGGGGGAAGDAGNGGASSGQAGGAAGTAGGSGGASGGNLNAVGSPGGIPGGGAGGGGSVSSVGGTGGPGRVVITFDYAGLTDSAVATDSISKTIILSKGDTAVSSDLIAKTITKPVSDSATASDSAIRVITLNKSDSVSATDDLLKTFIKNQADSVIASDNAIVSLVTSRLFAETVVASDALSKSLVHPVADSVSATDASYRALTKPVVDSVAATDLVTLLLSAQRIINDSVTATDSISKFIKLNKADSISGTAPAPTGSVIFAVLD